MKKFLYYIVYGTMWLISKLPFRALYVLSDVICLVVCYVIRYRRKVITQNLKTSFPEKSEEEIKKIRKGFYHWFCDYLVESIKTLSMDNEEMKKHLVFKGTEQLDEVVKSGRSCAMYLGHYCNWEWVTSLQLWVCPEAQCGQIYHPLENEDFDRLFLRIRERYGSVCIAMNNTMRKIIEFRRANQQVVIGWISDQKPMWNSIHHWLNFLNHDTPVLTGAERIIRSANHAVFYIDMSRPKRGYYLCEVRPIAVEPAKLEGEFSITDAYFKELEASIRRQPELYLWSHNRWSRTREEFNRRFEVKDGKVYEKPTE